MRVSVLMVMIMVMMVFHRTFFNAVHQYSHVCTCDTAFNRGFFNDLNAGDAGLIHLFDKCIRIGMEFKQRR